MLSSTIWNAKAECLPRNELEALQSVKLCETVRRCYENVPFYKKKMDEMGVKPEDIHSREDVRLLPFTDKFDLRDNYPIGFFAAPMSDIIRIHASSGTTGKPTTVGYTKEDIECWAECIARGLGCAGVTRGDIVQVSYGYGLFTGGLGLHYGAEKMGAAVVPTGTGNTKRQLMLMHDLGTDAIACTPSYAMVLAENIKDSGMSMDEFKLRVGIFGGEPWGEGIREQIEQALGIRAIDIYGLSETMGPGVAVQCLEGDGLHVWEDYFLVEVVDPETGNPLPDGEFGELVITTLGKQGMPTLRYRTHDITCIIPEPCTCGRTHRRIHRLRGRTDDMLIIRGVNVFPSQVETVLSGIDGVTSQFHIIVDRIRNLDRMTVQVELPSELPFDEVRNIEALRDRISRDMQSVLQISVNVQLVPPRSLGRSEGKTNRVTDNRKDI